MKYDFCFLYHPHNYDMDPNAQVGLGLLSLATYAKSLGATVKVINAQGERTPEIALSLIPKCKRLMLYGCMVDAPILNQITSQASMADRVYVGGPIAKSPEVLHLPSIECVVDGPGEDFISMLHFVRNQDEWGGKGKRFEDFQLEKNINKYPFPDRSLLEGKTGGNIFKFDPCKVSTTILTSRGCRFNCAFCTSGPNKFYQDYNINRIEKELEHCLSLGIKNIRVSDDNLISNTVRLNTLCALFKQAGISWRASIRTFPNYIGLYRTMAESGCKELSFGVESGDQYVLNVLNKGLVVTHNTEAVRNALNGGIEVVRALMIMGTPGETPKTIKRNIEWVNTARPSIVSLKMFVPYPGTDVHNNPKKYECKLYPIEDANNSAYRPDGSYALANIETMDMSRESLSNQFHCMKAYLERKGVENRG